MDLKKELERLKEYKSFVTDICFDYQKQPALGLLAIRVLSKELATEKEFRGVWLRWREQMGLVNDVPGKEETNNGEKEFKG